jgi:hypothetical protein
MRARILSSLLVAVLLVAARSAAAQQPGEATAAQPAEPLPPPPPPEPLPPPGPGDVGPMVPSATSTSSATDHDMVVRHWGIEARRLATVQRTPGQDPGCGTDCPLGLNALSLRRWSTTNYAWSAGLALAAGGGTSRQMGTGSTQSWDTYFGFGPTVGATFLLANWKHLAVGLSPQIDFVFFLPGGTRPKTLSLDVRGLAEGELHLGFIGLPQVSVGLSSGLAFNFTAITKTDTPPAATTTANRWSLGFTGPTSFWGLVTNAFLRFYF